VFIALAIMTLGGILAGLARVINKNKK